MRRVPRIFAAKILLALVLPSVTGCMSFQYPHYAVSMENIESLQSLNQSLLNKSKLGVGDFSSYKPGKNSESCRAAQITTPDGGPFEIYIKNALIEELGMAGIYSEESGLRISGRLDKIESSSFGSGWFLIKMSFVIAAGNDPLAIESIQTFSASWEAPKACRRMEEAFVLSVQDLLGKLFIHPEFRKALRAAK